MKIVKTLSLALAAALISGASHAAVTKYTEGNRDQIVGSTIVAATGNGPNDTTGTPPGYDLGTIGAGDAIEVYGRIINIEDFYEFTTTAAFSIKWIFGGYDSVGTNSIGQDAAPGESGFVSTPLANAPDGSATFTLTDLATNMVVATASFTTNVVLGDLENLFGGKFAAGNYSLAITGTGPRDALYDLSISTVPLPAGAILLVTALGGLGVARRRSRLA